MIEASCHCGAIQFAVETAPAKVNDCNCSICRRYGTLWGYYHPAQVRFATESGPTDTTCGVPGSSVPPLPHLRLRPHWSAVDRAEEHVESTRG